jgi:hypothetical protein
MNKPTTKQPTRVIPCDPELHLLLKAAAKRGYGKSRLGVVYEYANQQRINGDPVFSGRGFYRTMLRRVIGGYYDQLFN